MGRLESHVGATGRWDAEVIVREKAVLRRIARKMGLKFEGDKKLQMD